MATARSRAVSMGRIEGVPHVETPAIDVESGALLEQAGEVARVRVSGPLTVLRVGQEGTTSHDNPMPYVSVVVTTPNGEELAPVSPIATNNGVDETWESGPWWEYSFPGQTRYGWVPAGSTIRVRAVFYPQYSTPFDAWVNPQALSVARPGGCAPAISRDGTRAVVHDGRSLIEFDTETGTRRRTVCDDCGGPGFPVHPAYDADDRSVLFALDGVIRRTKPSADTEVALTLPDGEFATDPVVLADGSLAVLGERGVWVNGPVGLRLAAPGAGGVGVDGAGRLLAARRIPNLVNALDNPPQAGGQFFDVERNRPVASVPGAEHLFAGPGAGGARTRLTVFESQRAVSFRDYGIASSGANLGFLPVLSGPSDGLYGAPKESTFYRAFSSSRVLRPAVPSVVAPSAVSGGDVPITITGESPTGIRAVRAVIAGRAAQAEACADACQRPVSKIVNVNTDGIPEGTYRVVGAVRDGRGGFAFSRERFKLDRTAPEAVDSPISTRAVDGGFDVTWPSLQDPQLKDGSAGSGSLRLRVQPVSAAGDPQGDWSELSASPRTPAGVTHVRVQAVDAAGNTSRTTALALASTPTPLSADQCKPAPKAAARARLNLGLSLEPHAPQAIAEAGNAHPFLSAKARAFDLAWECFVRVMSPTSKRGRITARRLPDLRFMTPIDVMARGKDETTAATAGKPALWGPRKQLDSFFDALRARTAEARGKKAKAKWPHVVISVMSNNFAQCGELDVLDLPTKPPKPQDFRPESPLPVLGECYYPTSKLYRAYFEALVEKTLASRPPGMPSDRIHWTTWNEPTNKMFTLRFRSPRRPCDGAASDARAVCWAALYWLDARSVLKKRQLSSARVDAALPALEPPDTRFRTVNARARAFLEALGARNFSRSIKAWAVHPYLDFAPKSANTGVVAEMKRQYAKAETLYATEAGALLSVQRTDKRRVATTGALRPSRAAFK